MEDLYLIDDGKSIWKLARVDEKIQLVYLENCGGMFKMELEKKIEEMKIFKELNRLFKTSKEVMRKKRRHYMLEKSEIVLDEIENLEQFVGLYIQ